MTLEELVRGWQKSPIAFIKANWKLVPQPVKPEHQEEVNDLLSKTWQEWENAKQQFKEDWFEPFEKGKHLTWQQWLILLSVEKAIRGDASKHLSVKSGHGTGKSTTLSWLILWYLFCFKDAQIPCTAPTTEQMHDVLWKEIAKQLGEMPKPIQDLYEWQSDYIRIKERRSTWFARAKTARKESPEALAGVHGDFVMIIVDEASGVAQEIFNTAQGALTNENILFIMISNPTRLIGYFYDSHHKLKEDFQTLSFNSEESPIVDNGFVEKIIKMHGQDSDEYRIRVLGMFPSEDGLDAKGYVPLLVESDLRTTSNSAFITEKILGVDPSGEGNDESVWVMRDDFRAQIVGREKISNPSSIAQKTLTIMVNYGIRPENVFVDNFGEGANVAQELAMVGKKINAVNVGMKANDEKRYINKRAENSWNLREWLRKGGELIGQGWDDLLTVRYRAELSGKLKIMGKEEMRKEGIKSPNVFDALMLTFHKKISQSDTTYEIIRVKREEVRRINPGQSILRRSLTNNRRAVISPR